MKCLGEMEGGRHKALRGAYILIPIFAMGSFLVGMAFSIMVGMDLLISVSVHPKASLDVNDIC